MFEDKRINIFWNFALANKDVVFLLR